MLSSEYITPLRDALFSGKYNLLLGSGASVDSTSAKKKLMSAGDLTKMLCDFKKVPDSTSLSRVSLLLTADEVEQYITKPYSNCKPGETARRVVRFTWNSIYTFNIDDSLETAYESTIGRRQHAVPLNYDDGYRTVSNKSQVPIVHLHGFTRQSEKGYVFSTSEYARVTRGLNPWTHVLSECLASEPFIVAGTSLNESDLEYYLSTRTERSVRTNRGPSILVEPFPNPITEALCKRHGFVLVKSNLSDFLNWLVTEFGQPPTVSQICIPSLEGLFDKTFSQENQVEFFSSFELIKPSAPNATGEPSPFLFGKAPRWCDLESDLDLPVALERVLREKMEHHVGGGNCYLKFFCVLSEPGSGKTTITRRTSYDLAKAGRTVLNLTGKLALDIQNTRLALSHLTRPVSIVIDNLADHASSVATILHDLSLSVPVAVLCNDRDYREDHIARILGGTDIEYFTIENWPSILISDLIERYRLSGLVGQKDAVRYPEQYAERLAGEPVAVSCCRILNNFRSLDDLVHSLWQDADNPSRSSYAIASISELCYSGGVSYPILERANQNENLEDQLSLAVPLPLAYSEDGDYVFPLHAVVGDRVLRYLSRQNRGFLLDSFVKLANAVAPYVNRETIIARTPEARLAGRLFMVDRVVKPLLEEKANDFFEMAHDAWKWNSRYWEQRAILVGDQDINTAIQHARHAVAIEEHPLPLTTLASLLVKHMESPNSPWSTLFDEAFGLIRQAFEKEASRGWRPTPHPYAVLFHAVELFLQYGGSLTATKAAWVIQQSEYCQRNLSREATLKDSAARMIAKLGRK